MASDLLVDDGTGVSDRLKLISTDEDDNIDDADAEDGENDPEDDVLPEGLSMRVIEVKRVVNMTSGGKLESFSALVAVGNGNGACGFARGKSYEPGKATLVATRRAMRRLMYIPRFNEHTLTHSVHVKWEQTRLYMRPRPAGSGLTAHFIIQGLCELSGIRDISANIEGSTNKLNIVRAWFAAVQKQRTLEEVCQARGKNLVTFKRSVKVT